MCFEINIIIKYTHFAVSYFFWTFDAHHSGELDANTHFIHPLTEQSVTSLQPTNIMQKPSKFKVDY